MTSFWLIFCFFSLAVPPAADSDAKTVVSRLEAAYRLPKTLQATFLESYSEGGHTVRAESGTAYFRRPGKMRFEYISPEKNLFLVDGKYSWFYVPADHTVTRVPAKESNDWRTPLALLAGEMKVSRVCSKVELATKEQPEKPDHVLLYCHLRGATQASNKIRTGNSGRPSANTADEVFFEVV